MNAGAGSGGDRRGGMKREEKEEKNMGLGQSKLKSGTCLEKKKNSRVYTILCLNPATPLQLFPTPGNH